MDLVCGNGLFGSISNAVDTVRNASQKIKPTVIISAVGERTAYELQQRYGVDPMTAIQWAQGRGMSVTPSNLSSTMASFKSFLDSMKKRDASIGQSMAEGVAQRDAQFQRMGWRDFAEFSKAKSQIGSGAPSTFSKSFYLNWVEGQKQINLMRAQASTQNQMKLVQAQEQAQASKRNQALQEMGLKKPMSLLPWAIAGVGAVLLLK